jgi:sugar/nucleoside kinase (ribokinase family)
MSERAVIAKQTAEGVKRFIHQMKQTPVLIGFDGFVDSIISVVDKRYDTQRFDPVKTIAQFSEKISDAAGKSSNYELVVRLEKLGGNGPIMANAMASLGVPVTYVGALGYPNPHPVFAEFCKRANCLTIADPARTDALEFEDGKLMLGKLQPLFSVNWRKIDEVIGTDRFIQMVSASHMIGMVNWTMLPRVGEIWQQMIDRVLPSLAQLPTRPRRQIFIDLADPEKRTEEDLRTALNQIASLMRYVDVALGLNLKESMQVAKALGIRFQGDPEKQITQLAEQICKALGLYTLLIHTRSMAAAARRTGDKTQSGVFQGPYVAKPKISTGAGDHFNSGFCLGQLAGLDLVQNLCLGTAVSGYYVRNAASPTAAQVAEFCENLPDPQAK